MSHCRGWRCEKKRIDGFHAHITAVGTQYALGFAKLRECVRSPLACAYCCQPPAEQPQEIAVRRLASSGMCFALNARLALAFFDLNSVKGNVILRNATCLVRNDHPRLIFGTEICPEEKTLDLRTNAFGISKCYIDTRLIVISSLKLQPYRSVWELTKI